MPELLQQGQAQELWQQRQSQASGHQANKWAGRPWYRHSSKQLAQARPQELVLFQAWQQPDPLPEKQKNLQEPVQLRWSAPEQLEQQAP